ncbi:MAG: hypothetical protein ABS939_02405 [Psychrobacillus sp.]
MIIEHLKKGLANMDYYGSKFNYGVSIVTDVITGTFGNYIYELTKLANDPYGFVLNVIIFLFGGAL